LRSLKLLIFITFLNILPAKSQDLPLASYLSNPEVSNLFYSGFRHLYHFEFNACKDIANQLKGKYPASPWGHVLQAEYYWWMKISGDPQAENGPQLLQELEIAMLKAEALPEKEALFCKIISYSLKSRYALYNGQYFKAIELLNKSSDLIKTSKSEVGNYEPFMLTQGLFDYFMAAAGDKFGIFNPLSLFGIDADAARGLSMLESLTKSKDEILRTEAEYFLMKIYSELEKEPAKAAIYGRRLVLAYPQNLIFRYHYLVCAPEKKAQLPAVTTNPQLTKQQQVYLAKLLEKVTTK